jgi:Protein of unknown function (DUF2510)
MVDEAPSGEARTHPAGWYPHPSMVGTLRYWDGNAWTVQVAPAAAPPPASSGGPGVLTIAAGVVLGVAVLILGIWFILGVVTANDDLECATENAQRVQDGRPLLDCG